MKPVKGVRVTQAFPSSLAYSDPGIFKSELSLK
jgi:hypothetical protein